MARIRITDDDGVVAAIISVDNGYKGLLSVARKGVMIDHPDNTYDGSEMAPGKVEVQLLAASILAALEEARRNDLIALKES